MSSGGASSGGVSAGGEPSAGGGARGGGAGSSGSSGDFAGGGTSAPAGGTSGQGGAEAGTAGSSGAPATGPGVDRSDPRLYQVTFTAEDADPAASRALGDQHAFLDTRVEPQGKLVVYLHGAGDFQSCGGGALGPLVASFGFHWLAPCYLSNYGVDNCGDDIAGCRLEAFEGEDHHPFVDITRPDSIEERIVRGLGYLEQENPEGDWQYFLEGETPRWSEIVISGHSHGASSSGLIGVYRSVARVVMLAGPYDVGQAWLELEPLTPRDRFYGFSHTGDNQHQGHLDAFEALGLPGAPTGVDDQDPPYADSHRLFSQASVSDAHGSVTSGDIPAFVPVWEYLYGPSSM